MRYFIIHYMVIKKGQFGHGSFGMEMKNFPKEKEVRKAIEDRPDVIPNKSFCTGITEVSYSDQLTYFLNAK